MSCGWGGRAELLLNVQLLNTAVLFITAMAPPMKPSVKSGKHPSLESPHFERTLHEPAAKMDKTRYSGKPVAVLSMNDTSVKVALLSCKSIAPPPGTSTNQIVEKG
jgi:hypothetical protein